MVKINKAGHGLPVTLFDTTDTEIGTAATPLAITGSISAVSSAVATAAAPSYVEGSTNAFSSDLSGALRIGGTINATTAATATTASPSYSNGTSNALNANLNGALRVAIDQTTSGTTNAVDAVNFPDTLDVNSGVKSNSTIRVVLATDQPALTNKLLVTPDLPPGASTAAKQPALGTAGTASTDVITIQGIASMTKLLVTPDSVALPANQSVNVAQINGVTPLMGNGATGTGSHRVTLANDSTAIAGWGQGAVAGAVPSGAQYLGLIASTANPTAATAGNLVGAMADKLGKQVVVGAIRTLKGTQKATLSNTTSETTIVTAVASTFLDLYGIILANTGATTTKVDIRDTTGGSIIATIEVPTLETRGFMVPVDSGIPQTTVNTNWTAQCTAATTAMEVTSFYVKNI